jgi:DNA topoisomerase VI subunit B
MPTGAPGWPGNSKEKEEHNSISGLLGNWFLLMGLPKADVETLPQEYGARVEAMAKLAHTSAEKKTLQRLHEQFQSASTKWTATKIVNRTNKLVTLLEEAWPEDPKDI